MLFSVVVVDFSLHLWILLLIPAISCRVFSREISDEQTPEYIPCEEGWFFFEEKCYKVGGLNNGLTWEQASNYCKQEQGDLVTIQSKDLQDFLVAFLLLEVKSSVWIGLNDRLEHAKYQWSDGSPVTYFNWDYSEPDEGIENLDGCVQMTYFCYHNRIEKGNWKDYHCETKLPYICQSNKRETSRNLDPRFCSNGKGRGWKHLNSCYHFVSERKSWEDAEKHCQNIFKGHLVTIIDESAKIYVDYIMSNFTDDLWIGIKIKESTPQRWASGWRVIFDTWDASQAVFEDGLCTVYSYGKLWRTAPCSYVHSFICETSTDKPPIEENWECPSLSDRWINTNGKLCYMLYADKSLKWFEANYECMRKGGALASISSAAEADNLRYVIDKTERTIARMYIGLHRSYTDKTIFEWVDGSEMNYQHWDFEQPSHVHEECGEMYGGKMTWNDIECDRTLNFMCSAKKVLPEVEENMYEINGPSLTCPNITKETETELRDCVCKGNSSDMDEDMAISNKGDSRTDESNTSTEKMKSDSENDQMVSGTTEIFIDTSILTPQDKNEEKLYISPLSGKDSSQDLSQTESALVEPTKVKKVAVAEQQALILQQRKGELELSMKFKVEEHKLRMSVLKAQLNLLNQISELIALNPEAMNVII